MTARENVFVGLIQTVYLTDPHFPSTNQCGHLQYAN